MQRRFWPGTESRWWSICALLVLLVALLGVTELMYLWLHGRWMPWR